MPKRRSTLANSKAASKIKVSKPNSFLPEENSNKTISERNSKCRLQSLPNDVLEHIYSFCSIKDLLPVLRLKCGRVSDLVKCTRNRNRDFSSCADVLPAEFQLFFSASITHHIEEINFTGIFLVDTSDLVKAIVSCKCLKSLTVLLCGVTFENMQHILVQCKQLKKLRWNVLATVGEDNRLELGDLQIENLYIDIDCIKSSEIGFYLLRSCPAVTEACFNFTSLISPHFPFKSWHKNVIYKLHSDPICPVDIILDDYFENLQSVYDCIMATKWCSCSNPVGSLDKPMTTSYLQVVAKEEDYPRLLPGPEENVRELVLYYANLLFLQEKMEDIKRVMGKNLDFLAVKVMKRFEIYSEEEHKLSMDQMVPKLLTDCSNLQVLILAPIHFRCPLKLGVLFHLRGLKTLALSSCAFTNDQWVIEVDDDDHTFEKLVGNTKQVEHFSIIDCEFSCYRRGPEEQALYPISKWNKLKTLSIINVKSLTHCSFLKGIPVDCPDFKSLEIIDLHSTMVHHYIPNVMTFLEKSPQLIQLCMNMDVLCVQNFRFWNSISSAKKLQGLCLTMAMPADVHPRSITEAIEKLPCLHLFHLSWPSTAPGLALTVKRIMKSHGVMYPKVELTTIKTLPMSNFTVCDCPHIYIE